MMLLRPSPLSLVFVPLVGLLACNSNNQPATQPAVVPDTRVADEAAIRAQDADWVRAVAAKDVPQTVTYYADDSQLFAPGAPSAAGKEVIQKGWEALFAVPGFALSFAPSKVQVARSGDLAYETGEYEMTTNDKKGKPQTVKAKYVVVWGKQPDGKWKALVDSPTTTTP